MVYVVKAGIREEIKTEAEKFGCAALGGFGGFGVTEFTGEYIVKAMKISDATKKFLTKALIRTVFGVGFAVLSWHMSGLVSWILFSACAGSFAGIFYDLMEWKFPGGLKGLAESMAIGDEVGNNIDEPYFEPPEPDVNVEISGAEVSSGNTVNAGIYSS